MSVCSNSVVVVTKMIPSNKNCSFSEVSVNTWSLVLWTPQVQVENHPPSRKMALGDVLVSWFSLLFLLFNFPLSISSVLYANAVNAIYPFLLLFFSNKQETIKTHQCLCSREELQSQTGSVITPSSACVNVFADDYFLSVGLLTCRLSDGGCCPEAFNWPSTGWRGWGGWAGRCRGIFLNTPWTGAPAAPSGGHYAGPGSATSDTHRTETKKKKNL